MIGKHHIHRINWSIPKVIDMYQERPRKNDWGEKEEHDDLEFIELEKKIWMEMFPETAKKMLKEEEDDEEELKRKGE